MIKPTRVIETFGARLELYEEEARQRTVLWDEYEDGIPVPR